MNMAGMELSVPWVIVCVIAAALFLWQAVEGLLRAALFLYMRKFRKNTVSRGTS